MAETLEMTIETLALGRIRVQMVPPHAVYRVSFVERGEWGPWKRAEIGSIEYDDWRAALVERYPDFGKEKTP